jgi:TonB family protein
MKGNFKEIDRCILITIREWWCFMRLLISLWLCGVLGLCCLAQSPNPPDTSQSLLIGRQTYFDFGPPFDYFEVIQVHPDSTGVDIERALLTPDAGCFQPAKVEYSTAHANLAMHDILSDLNLCSIKQSQINRELKRRKHGLVFSGANVSFETHCSGGTRVIPAAVLDRDWFAAKPDTPQFTSLAIQVLQKLDEALGPSVMEKPIFPTLITDASGPAPPEPRQLLSDISDGKIDGLFPGTTFKVSEIYSDARKPPRAPAIELAKSEPFKPDVYSAPKYPPIAKAARVEGTVSFHLKVDENCAASEITIDSGPKMLQQAVSEAVKDWKYCKSPKGQMIQASIEFRLNCHDKQP